MLEQEHINPAENPPSSPEQPLSLNSRQQMLYEALIKIDDSLARIYFGAIRVLSDSRNPDRLALAAHNLRELLSKLPRYLGIDSMAQNERMSNKVWALKERWDNALNNSTCRGSANWEGEIDPPLQGLLEGAQNFFEWYETHRPRMKAVVAQTLRRLDQAPVVLPQSIEDLHVSDWHQYYGNFVALAHHDKTTSAGDFVSQLTRLELFLLERLRPRTFAEIDEIDEIIRQAEDHARS